MKVRRFELELVELMPSKLEPGVLYVSDVYGTAAHLCACGCGQKIRTQLGSLGWTLRRGLSGPTLEPSIGNWQQPCRSHYCIEDGEVIWAGSWTPDQVEEGRAAELRRREAFFAQRSQGWWDRIRAWWRSW